jgi:hypothetical protein
MQMNSIRLWAGLLLAVCCAFAATLSLSSPRPGYAQTVLRASMPYRFSLDIITQSDSMVTVTFKILSAAYRLGVTNMNRTPFILALAFLFASCFLQGSPAQNKERTLRDEANEKGSASRASYPEDLFLATLDQLVARSDLIIVGRVVDEKTRLSADEDYVFTDYTVEVLEILKDSAQHTEIGKRLTVSKEGGNVVVDGRPIRVDTPTFPGLRWITPHLLFLARPKGAGADVQWHFVGGTLGALEINDDRFVCRGKDLKLGHPITHAVCNKPGAKEDFLQRVRDTIAEQSRPATTR